MFMPNTPDDLPWWSYLQIRLLLTVLYGVLLFEAWSMRDVWMSQHIFKSAHNPWMFFSSLKKRQDVSDESRWTKQRMENMRRLFSMVPHIISLIMVITLLFVENFEMWGPHEDLLGFSSILCFLPFAYFLTQWLCAFPFTQRRVDICYAVFYAISYFMVIFWPSREIVAFAVIWYGLRMFVSVSYMKAHVTCVANLLHGLLACWRFRQQPVLDPAVYPNHSAALCGSELLGWVIIGLVCVVTEQVFSELLQSELSSHSAKHGAERLLSCLCDSVVRLGPDLRITRATPQLMHLLCPTHPMAPSELEGTLFSCHLANATDMEKYSSFISSTPLFPADQGHSAGGLTPTALHVDLHHPRGRQISAQLFHVCFEGADRQLEHLIGISEVREEGAAPDESLFEGRKTSFEHQAEGARSSEDAADPRCITQRIQHVASNHSSKSSSCSSTKRKVVKCCKRNLGLRDVGMTINPTGLEIQRYTLRFSHESKQPNVLSCLLLDEADPFIAWLQEGINQLVHFEHIDEMDYTKTVIFRPPTAACASSKVVLSARSATLLWADQDEDHEDTLELRFNCVCQLIKSSTKGNKSDLNELPSLHEEALSDDEAIT